jgi:hypothetical protein
LQLRGEVASYQIGIGFGLMFSFLTEDEEQSLLQFHFLTTLPDPGKHKKQH